jgi:hypothetical protein
MKAHFTIRHLSTDVLFWTVILPFSLFLLAPSCGHAEDNTAMTPMPLISDRPSNSALASVDRNYRLGLLRNYLRQQEPVLVAGLPDTFREPANFAAEQMKSAEEGLGFEGEESETGSAISSALSPVLSLIRPMDEGDAESLWLSPGYHHTRGMLPFDDALTMGFTYRNAFLDNRVKFDVHPFYAQSWNSAEGYWGTEMTLGLGPAAGHSWGTIVVRYDNGSSNLMDHGRGFDMHADLSFSEHLSLTAGAEQNNPDDLGNYVLLKWRLVGGNK